MGILVSVALPMAINYSIKAQATEGVLILGELRRRVEISFNRNRVMPDEIPSSPTPDGELFGGPYYNYTTLFGAAPSDMWERIEFQPKGPHRVLVLRAFRKESWGNSDIGLHIQIKLQDDNTLRFRCVIDEVETREPYAPSTCFDGSANDWTSW